MNISVFALAIFRLLLAVDFIKRAHLGEIHVTRRAAHFAVGTDIIRPQVVGHKLVDLDPQAFQREQVMEGRPEAAPLLRLVSQWKLRSSMSNRTVNRTSAAAGNGLPGTRSFIGRFQ